MTSEWFTDNPVDHNNIRWGDILEAVLLNGETIQGELYFDEQWSEDNWWWVSYIAQPEVDVALHAVEKWRIVE